MIEKDLGKKVQETKKIECSPKTLPELVEVKLMDLCGFNYYETSFPLPGENQMGDVHVSEPYPLNGNRNIVLIEQRRKEDNYKNIHYYFGIFAGKPMIDRETSEETDEYMQEVWKVLDEEHEISFREVRNRLISTLDKKSQSVFKK